MIRLSMTALVALLPLLCGATSAAAAPPKSTGDELRLTVPPRIYAVAGQELRIDFDNLVLTTNSEQYKFTIGRPAASPTAATADSTAARWGTGFPRYWSLKPTARDVGTHRLNVAVRDAQGKPLAEATTELHVAPADAGAGRELALLIVGDSLTHATHYPNEWARLLNQPGNPKWTMLGTHKPKNAAEGVAHEGYGGWTWRAFVERYAPKPEPEKRIHSSPFVFADAAGKPRLDVGRYIAEKCGGRKPDFVTFLLGINDCFGAPPADPTKLDAHIDGVFQQADLLLAEFHKVAPEAKLAVCLTTPPNSREEAFQANYGDKYTRANWKRIQHRLVQRELEHFAGREAESIYVVPTELDLDPTDGYPANNGVHPNPSGYARIAASLHAWLKYQLATKP